MLKKRVGLFLCFYFCEIICGNEIGFESVSPEFPAAARKQPPRRATTRKKKTTAVTETDVGTHADAATLGKTHFIVGQPTHYIPPKKATQPQPVASLCEGLLCQHDGSVKQALFSPDDHVQDVLIDLINKEQKSINIAVFSFTNGGIADALIDAHNRGVTVMVLIDNSGLQDRFNKIERLHKAGIKVRVYKQVNTKGLFADKMHNKFALFGNNLLNKSLVWTGSFNFTKAATQSNQENVVILDDRDIVERFNKQFVQLQQRCVPVRISQIT